MINKIKKPLVKDLRPKTNSIQGKEVEIYVPGEPLKKSSIKKTESGSTQYGKSKRSSAIILNILCFILGAAASAAVCLLFIK
jgi:hypothetical protein